MHRSCLTALLVVAAWATCGIPAATAQVYQLSRIVVVGVARLPAATVVGMTGLKPATQITTMDVERARQRLLDSGLFASVGYRFRMTGHSLTVTFTVEEPPWNAPILFDNFVWFTDEELARAVAGVLPGFAGFAPSLPKTLQRIAQTLDVMIRRAGIQGSVSYMPASSSLTSVGAYLYRIDLPAAMPVCAIELEGVSPLMIADARASIQLIIGQDYSREFVRKALTANLLPLYGQRGYLKAEYDAVRARISTVESCKAGVIVSASVREGQPYTWAGATWSGANGASQTALDARLGLTLGAIIDARRFEQGLEAVRDQYARQGYIAARTMHVFQFADGAGTASASITVIPGPRVKMGSCEIQGLPADSAALLKAEWTHPAGEYYDALYVRDYLKSARSKHADVFRGFPNVSVTTTPAGDSTVNVTITFARQ